MSVALTAVLSFFMGIGQPRLALLVNGLVVLLNAVFNAWFIWGLGMGGGRGRLGHDRLGGLRPGLGNRLVHKSSF
jgi:hypothetical protein